MDVWRLKQLQILCVLFDYEMHLDRLYCNNEMEIRDAQRYIAYDCLAVGNDPYLLQAKRGILNKSVTCFRN